MLQKYARIYSRFGFQIRHYAKPIEIASIIDITRTVVETNDVQVLNSSYIEFRRSLNLLTSSGDIDSIIGRLSKFCADPVTVYLGMLCRVCALLNAGRLQECMEDVQTLLLLDNQAAIKKGSTGYTNERILLLANHFLYNLLLMSKNTDKKKLESCVQSIQQLNPDFMPGCLDVANFYQSQPDHAGDDIAEENYNRAVELCPENEEAILSRSLYFSRNKHTVKRAVIDCKRVLSINPNNAEAKELLKTLK
ncbi:DnaJ [Acrasis kona]|uniref:DnaJ n=1 Tax=Acrasis kona TaxID=1008807 RepID=A0AAW2ZLB3_9EUKA